MDRCLSTFKDNTPKSQSNYITFCCFWYLLLFFFFFFFFFFLGGGEGDVVVVIFYFVFFTRFFLFRIFWSKVGKMPANMSIFHAGGIYR